MPNLIVAGIGTGVGKTVVAAILTILFKGGYWKPIECGDSDTATLKKLIGRSQLTVYSPAYSLKAPRSPHHAARLEKVKIEIDSIHLPQTDSPLIIESVGGILVPLAEKVLSIELFKNWNCRWVIVSKHYLGSINHTLLTLQVLKTYAIPVLGLIFNGKPDSDTEGAILEMSQLPLLGRLLPERAMTFQTIQRYVKQWQPRFLP
jgi:dethiobiotin synthetase